VLKKQENDGNREPHATLSKLENTTLSSRQETVCSNCASTDHLVAKIVSGLLTLEENIRIALALSQTSQNVRSQRFRLPDAFQALT
jgi:hypothetical protein